ncbi:MAG TPA: ABC transporter substrate binding protein [Methylomirabilota bacterium]|nr:ABC transporter substrate binding protein [Methylomirabilota bacterium]
MRNCRPAPGERSHRGRRPHRQAAQAARGAATVVPVVMVDPGDPVRTKLVASLRQPGGNLTGLSSATPDLAAKHLQLLEEAVPGLARVGFCGTQTPRPAPWLLAKRKKPLPCSA